MLETVNGGGYTYARVSTDDGESWVAGPETDLEVGQRVAVTDLMQMENFTSSTLDRTFDVLYFASSYVDPGAVTAGNSLHGAAVAIVAASAVTTALLVIPIRRWARARGFVDQPSAGAHKGHRQPIALGGGVAVFVGFRARRGGIFRMSACQRWTLPLCPTVANTWGLPQSLPAGMHGRWHPYC